MHLEEAMKLEVERLEREIIVIDIKLESLQKKIIDLVTLRKKKEHDLIALRAGNEAEETLARMLRGQVTV